MATLQKIRNRAGILIAIIIGVAIFAFVLQDLLTGGNSAIRHSRIVFAEIDGKAVSYEEYAAKVEELSEYYRLRFGITSLTEEMTESIREEAWNMLVRKYVTMDEYKKLGISVSTDEVMDMVQGRNPHPIIRQLFADPQTGILNRSFLLQFIRTMNEDPTGAQRTIWMHLENQIINDKAFTKYNNLIRKGLYTTDLEAESSILKTDNKVDFSYIRQTFANIPDSAISYTETDLRNYYNENINQFKQTASRDIEYVVFEVVPSEEDDQNAKDWINRMENEFKMTDDVASFVNIESDIPYDGLNHTYDELSENIRDFMFSAQPGDVYGPYMENESYRLARLVEINYLPDSVSARHILIQPDQTVTADQAKQIADSLKNLIDHGADFATLALQNSVDGSAQDGGDLGWFREGRMVKPFSDACFEGDKGDVLVVETQFGYHVIEILDQSLPVKKVKVAILAREIKPSSETYQEIYAKAVEFAGVNNTYEKFNTAINQQNLIKRYASEITESQRDIAGLEHPRPLIQWAFEAELHEISTEVFELGNKFVVAAVTAVREEGFAPFEQVKNEIALDVEINKKAEKIIGRFQSEMNESTTLEDLADIFNLQIQEATNISFSSISIPSAGIEPKVIGTATSLPEGVLSPPVQGNNGVYVLVVNAINQSEEVNTQTIKNRLNIMRQSQVYSEAYQALLDASDIKDNRYKFF
jgi:peptidyl-prolyl cis-trans isomerase D